MMVLRVEDDVLCRISHYVERHGGHSKRGVNRQGSNEDRVVRQKGIKEMKG